MENEKEIHHIDNLVICSTLNQITNYLIIKKYNPKRIYNITFAENEELKNTFNINIQPKKWDDRLKESVKNIEFRSIFMEQKDVYSIEKIKEKIDIAFEQIDKNQKTYWHVTGGQRVISIAISEFIKNRKNDKLLYIEGNTEKIIQLDYNGMNSSDGLDDAYGDNTLDFETALKLVGFETDELKCNSILKSTTHRTNLDENEMKFYWKIYELFNDRGTTYQFPSEKVEPLSSEKQNKDEYKQKDTFRNLLLKSNKLDNKKSKDKDNISNRSKYVELLFDTALEKVNPEFKSEKNKSKENEIKYDKKYIELDKSCPAGYILEKVAAYQIYKCVSGNAHVVDLRTSLKTKSNEENDDLKVIDEVDIILLTDTGKIINFECKSGEMSGDNAKSTNYTTYRLAGVFGMPVLISPLYNEETKSIREKVDYKSEKSFLKNQISAYRSARRAELPVINIDCISASLKKLGIEA